MIQRDEDFEYETWRHGVTTAKIIEADERRHARDSYRDHGGSARRPLKSFLTAAEKRQARDDHAARIHLAVDELADPCGFERWAESLTLNPHLSAMNAALVALQTPGEIAGSSAYWHKAGYKVGKGERAAGRITAPGFWPLPYFTAAQASATDLAEFDPPEIPSWILDAAYSTLRERLAAEKARPALDAVAGTLR
jgi:hypothetical protein